MSVLDVDNKGCKVMMVGSAEQSGGGVSTVLKLMKQMPFWKKYNCFWLGTQIQRNYLWKLWYALKSNILACFIIWRYDIIHFHTVPDFNCMLIQLPVFLLSRLTRKKIIMHVHVGNQLANHVDNRFFIWLLTHSSGIVFLAEKWKTFFMEHYVTRHVNKRFPRLEVVYNACEMTPCIPFENKEKIIIMAVYFCENKAPDLLLKAWSKLKTEYPDWHIWLLGNGNVSYYKSMADEMNISDSVSFTGYLTGKERELFFRKASIYCMCSYMEGFPMVVLESWMYGLNVVTTPVGGLPDVIEDGKNCLVFDFGDSDSLADKLRMLIDDVELRKSMADYSRMFVEKRFSPETINISIDSLYKSLMNS